jgi:hypothetical protein
VNRIECWAKVVKMGFRFEFDPANKILTWNSVTDFRRRNLSCLVTRPAEATPQRVGGRPAKRGSVEGRQQERPHRRPQAGGAITHEPAQAGLSRRTRNPHVERTVAQLSHGQQRCHSLGEPDQVAVSQLGRETLFADSRQIQKSSAKSMSN